MLRSPSQRVVEPDSSQDEHGQGDNQAAEAHQVQVRKGGRGVKVRREDPSQGPLERKNHLPGGCRYPITHKHELRAWRTVRPTKRAISRALRDNAEILQLREVPSTPTSYLRVSYAHRPT